MMNDSATIPRTKVDFIFRFIMNCSLHIINFSIHEDPTCSDSLGPAYSVIDHYFYLNVNYWACFVDQAEEFLALPYGIFDPVKVLPPLPTPIYNFEADFIDSVVNVVGPILGR